MTADTVGGVFDYSIELMKNMAKYNVEYVLATMGKTLSEDQKKSIEEIPNLKLYQSGYQLEWMDDPWKDVEEAGEWLLQIERIENPDIVHLNNFVHGYYVFSSPKIVVAHSCVYSWFNNVQGKNPPEQYRKYRSEVAEGLSAADIVVAPSSAMLGEVEKYYCKLKNKRTIYNGRNPEDFYRQKKENIIFSAGRIWDEAKNIFVLEKIADKLNWKVFIAGNSKHPSGQNYQFKNIHHLGFLTQSEMKHWFSKAAILVLPAKYEPFGLTILEAALSGAALIIGNIRSLNEIWRDAAIYVDPENECEIVAAVNDLIKDEGKLKEMRGKSFKRALNFSSKKMAAEYFDLYQELLVKKSIVAEKNKRIVA